MLLHLIAAAAIGSASPRPALDFDAAINAQLETDTSAILRATHAPGAVVAIAHGAKVVYTRAFGLRDVTRSLPMSPECRFEIGSITKQFTAAAILQLSEAGKVDLNARLNTYLPQFPHAGEITIRQMLNQTSGLPDYMTDSNIESLVRSPASFDQLTARIAEKPLDFRPGVQWEYSNTNFLALGRVIEIVSGQRWEQYTKEHLFDPAGMANSSTIEAEPEQVDMASGYTYENGQLTPSTRLNESWAFSAGGIISTVGDLVKWGEALSTGRIISPASYALLTTPGVLIDGSPIPYALGIYSDTFDGQQRIWHDGNTFGFDASDQYFPNQDTRIIVLTNSADSHSDEIAGRLYNDIFPAIASAALNGASGTPPELAPQLIAHAHAVSATMDPLEIYRTSIATMRSVIAPQFLQFKVQTNTTHQRDLVIQHFVYVERTSDRSDKVRDVDPVINHNFHPFELTPDLFLGHTATTGAPPAANTFSLGLDEEQAAHLKTIAVVAANRPSYAVHFAGIEPLAGCGASIHLKLEPLKDPMRFNVRDLWIESSTSRICKADAVWFATLQFKRVVALITLDLNADGLIDRYSFSASAHFIVGSDSAHQDGFITELRSVSESAWATAPNQ